MEKAQEWLGNNNQVKKINSENKKLEGELLIDNFPNLTEVNVRDAERITKLTIIDCPKVKEILAYNNQITEIEGIDKLSELRKLDFAKNKVEKMDVSQNAKLVYLVCHNNPNLKEITGVENLSQLTFFNGKWNSSEENKGTVLRSVLNIAEMVGSLGIDEEKIKGRKIDETKKIIDDELEKANKYKKILTEIGIDLNSEELKSIEKYLEKKANLEKQIQKLTDNYLLQIVQELRKLRIYLGGLTKESTNFIEWRKEINRLEEVVKSQKKLNEGQKRELTKIVSEIIAKRTDITRIFEDEIKETQKNLEEVKKIIKENKESWSSAISKFFSLKNFDFNEKLEKSLEIIEESIKREKNDLEVIKEILRELIDYQKELENKIETFPQFISD
ncbi:MAG: hypothetical protein mread185_000352 [Mycoplasmataceae bacterium]|nr:MAG: hypothetical protein mread185_000352 [Mycoplasmataceae bacterium]